LADDFTEHHEDIVLGLEPCRVALGPDKHEMFLEGRELLECQERRRAIFGYPKSIHAPNRSTYCNGLILGGLMICNSGVHDTGLKIRQTLCRVTQIPPNLMK
jgi:hypothetical protein